MRGGDLRHRIIIQFPNQIADGLGGLATTWEFFAEVAAAIWPTTAKERVQDQQLAGQITHKIRIRYLHGIVPQMRILFGKRIFQIAGPPINFEERNVQLDFLCVEVLTA